MTLKEKEQIGSTELIKAGMMLRGRCPEDWASFVSAMETLAEVAVERMLVQHGSDLIRMQGFAQAMKTHAEFLAEIHKHAAALNNPKPHTHGKVTI